jgi:hypothetical protein
VTVSASFYYSPRSHRDLEVSFRLAAESILTRVTSPSVTHVFLGAWQWSRRAPFGREQLIQVQLQAGDASWCAAHYNHRSRSDTLITAIVLPISALDDIL